MTVQSAILFGFALGITLFILYLSFVSHSDQWIGPKTNVEGVVSSLDQSPDITSKVTVPNTNPSSNKDENLNILSLSPAELSLLKKGSPVQPSIPPVTSKEDPLLARIKQEKLSKFSELSPEKSCLRMKKKFHVVPGHSWGKLPNELQQ